MRSFDHRRFILAVCILLLAATLRLWRISQLPPGLYHDEAFLRNTA